MKTIRAWFLRIRGFLGHGLSAHDIDAELRNHVELQYEENLRAGMLPREAHRQSLLTIGGIERTRQAYRERATIPLAEEVLQDLRFTFRQLVKSPGFTFTAITVFALSVAGCLAIYAFVDAALVQPLPYRQPSKLVALFERLPIGERYHLSFADYLEWKRLNKSFTDLAVYRPDTFVLKTPSGARAIQGAMVSGGFFETLGVAPILGRDFKPEDDRAGGEQKVILSHETWTQQFQADTNVIGRTIRLDGESNVIVGVLPEGFHFAPLPAAGFWRSLHGLCAENRTCYPYYGIARLKNGASIQSASDDLNSISLAIAADFPLSNRDRSASVISLTDLIVGNVRPILTALLGGAGLLSIVGFVNVFNLLLVRAEGRRHETSVRAALGASRLRLVRQFAVEGYVLAGCGGLVGLLLALGLVKLVIAQMSQTMLDRMPYLYHVQISSHLFMLAAVMTLVGGLLFTAAPTIQLESAKIQRGLLEGGRNAVDKSWRTVGAGLLVIELAITVTLLVSAGLLTKSLHRFLEQDIGLDPEHLAVLHIWKQGDPDDATLIALGRQIIPLVSSLPGVKSVGISVGPALNGAETFHMMFAHFKVAGRPYSGLGNEAFRQAVSVNYFETLRASLLEGRYFANSDTLSNPHVAVVNEAMAAQNFPGEDPLRKRILSQYDPENPIEIIGVVKDLKDGDLDTKPTPAVYVPFDQVPDNSFYVTFRASGGEESLFPPIKRVLRELDADLVVDGEETLLFQMDSSEPAELHRASAWIAAASALLSLLLGTVGLYGLIAYSVGRRTREIGVRMALGAQRSSIYKLVLKEAGLLAILGIALGTLFSFAATRFLRGLFFRVNPWDAQTLLSVAAILAIAALIASYLPAHRAANIEPTEALRID